ncbi:MAG: histidine kinase dimerization/phospho-acceptor domain-containing protein [Caldilineales bacterium]
MNRLAVRLALAIVGTTLLTVALVAVVANRAAGTEFRRYVAAGQMAAGEELAGELAAYYASAGSWAGVADQLDGAGATRAGHGRGGGRGGMSAVVLADASGEILYDNQTGRAGDTLTRGERSGALPVTVRGQQVGYLLVMPPGVAQLAAPEKAVLDRINLALAGAAALALLAGSLLGIFLARTLARPVVQVAAAAESVAAGDLSQRVPIEGALEMQTLGRSFNLMAGNLEQAEQLRRNLLADVAHELRTPLTVIQGNLQALLDGVYPLERAEIATIYDETRLLSRLVADLRELAQAEAGQLQLDLQPTDVAAILRQTADSFAPFGEAREVSIRTDLAGSLPLVMADADRVGQVLRNLVSNALRHAAHGGEVMLCARAVTFDRTRRAGRGARRRSRHTGRATGPRV